MLNYLLNALFDIAQIFERSRDPLLEQYRSYQRHMILAGACTLGTTVLAELIAPTAMTPSLATAFTGVISELFAVVAALALIWMLVASFMFWRFIREQ